MDNDDPHPCEVTVEAQAWNTAVADPVDLCRTAAFAALSALPPELEAPPGGAGVSLSVLLGDDARLAALNAEWRGRDAPTNVLSFPAFDDLGTARDAWPAGEPLHLGDVAVALETLLREAEAEGKSPAAHLTHLTVHGVLHLLGYDHEDEGDASRMEALESRLVTGLGYPDPYRDDDGPGSPAASPGVRRAA